MIELVPMFGGDYDQAKLEESLDTCSWYFRLKTFEKVSLNILHIRHAYKLKGHFLNIEFIWNLEFNAADYELSAITPEMIVIADILSDLTDLDSEIIQTLLDCVELFTWTAGVLHNSANLDNLTYFALNTVDSNVIRVTSFKEVSTIFMPFILGMEKVDEHCFLTKLKLVHENLKKTSKADTLLAMSRDCAKQSEIDFWKKLNKTFRRLV